MDKSKITRDILSNITIYNKYAKYLPHLKRRENWTEIVYRYIEMMVRKYPLLSDEIYKNASYILDKKVFPSMRALQFAGKAIDVTPTRLYNCAFLAIDTIKAFSETMFLLLGGSGVGYSVQKHHVDKLPPLLGTLSGSKRTKRYLISDNIEGWADSIRVLFESYFMNKLEINFDYSDIRPKGSRLVTAGGKAPGPQPLKDCIHNIKKVLDLAIEERGRGTKLKTIETHDIECYIADAVLAGGIRRSAMVSLFSINDDEMMNCKTGTWYELNPQRGRSNNSVVLLRHKLKEKNFSKLFDRIEASKAGEPGFFLTNDKELGSNPCMEISLKSNQFCNLTTIDVSNVESQEDLNERAKVASFWGTLQAGFLDFHYLNNSWSENCENDALLGISMTGIASGNVLKYNMELASTSTIEENKRVSSIININPSKRLCCIKPEGCQTKDTIVSTEQGILSLEEIGDVLGDQWQDHKYSVYTDDGIKNSPRFHVNGLAETNVITMDSGITLEATNKHKYRVITTNGKYVWKQASDLSNGDIMPYSIGEYVGGSIQTLNAISTTKFNGRIITQPNALDEDLAWLIGLYTGDGSNHKKGIRIHGNYLEQKGFTKAIQIIKDKFNINAKVVKYNNDDNDKRCAIYVNSTLLLKFLTLNTLSKNKSKDISIPSIVRMSKKSIIESFLDGYACADGCDKSNTISYCTTSKVMAKQLPIVLRAIGRDCKVRVMPATKSSFGVRDRYWIQERKGRSGNILKNRTWKRESWDKLDALGFNSMSADVVVSNDKSSNITYDIEVNDNHTFFANSYISHNTVSLVAGTSSGIHAWHSEYYIRRMSLTKDDALYKYLKKAIPSLLEDSLQDPEKTSYLTIPVKAPDGAILRSESEIDMLERVKLLHEKWIKPSHISGSNTHNVSCTINIKDDNWGTVKKWMWENRDSYTGISLFPYDGGSYTQTPFEECTKEKYEELLSHTRNINLDKVIEEEDNVDLKGELACAGGACEIS